MAVLVYQVFSLTDIGKSIIDTLVLNSVKPESCFFIRNFGADWFLRDDDGRILFDDDGRAIRRTTIEDCTPCPWLWTSFLVFENEKFIIEDSTLVHIRKQHHCFDEKNDFIRECRGILWMCVQQWYNWEKWINQIDEEKWCLIEFERLEQLWEQRLYLWLAY